MKRLVSRMTIGLALVLGLIGFTIIPSAQSESWLTKAAAPYKGTTIDFPAEAVPAMEFLKRELVPIFEEKTGINVNVIFMPQMPAIQRIMMDLTGKTRKYEIIEVPCERIGSLADAGFVQPIEKYMNDPELRSPNLNPDDFIKQAWKVAGWWDGKIYGFPSVVYNMILWYRKDLFNNPSEKAKFAARYGYELKLPITWTQYRDIAEFFTRKKGEKLAGKVLDNNFYGVVTTGKRHPSTEWEFLNYLFSWGGSIFSKGFETGEVVINSPRAVEALEYFVSLRKFAPPGALHYTWDEVTTAFQQNRGAMSVQWADQAAGVEDPQKSLVAGKVGYTLYPIKRRRAHSLGPMSLLIPTQSKAPEAAYLFMQWAMSKEIQTKWAQSFALPLRRSVYEEPSVKENPALMAAGAAMEYAVTLPRIPEWPEMSTVLQRNLSSAMAGEMTPKEALDNAAEEFKKILREK